MTYCVALRLDEGLVFLSDSRTNAGVDHVSSFRKMVIFERPGDRVLVLMTAGNLAITQATRELLEGHDPELSLWAARDMVDAVRIVGDAVRRVHARDARHLEQFHVDFNCSFILGGQIQGEPCRLFQVYSAGNHIEAQDQACYFQIGESKYGKPILDRVVTPATTLDEATKCALISMDSTLRSNVSVGLPLDLLVYRTDSLRVERFASIDAENTYFREIQRTWGQRLRQVFEEIPAPPWEAVEPPAPDDRLAWMRRQPVRAVAPEQSGGCPPLPERTLPVLPERRWRP